ncbi:MAG: FtsX-like permease family protein [Burkholderiales bacterium]
MSVLRLALVMLWREVRAGEFRALAIALAIAVAALTTVSFFSDRVARTLDNEANQMLGADLIVIADHTIPENFLTQAASLGLSTSQTVVFPSMAVHGELTHLVDIKAVGVNYPLRGKLRTSSKQGEIERETNQIPSKVTAWVVPRILDLLRAKIGDRIELGAAQFTIAAIIAPESDTALDFLNVAPRILINQQDVAATELLGVGSRVSYRLLLAGTNDAIAGYRAWVEPKLARGERVEGVRDARPEVRAMLERAGRFLGLCSLMAAIIAAVAVALAARRFATRQLDQAAVMRCVGATQRTLVSLYLVQLLILGSIASAVGIALGWCAQFGLGRLLSNFAAMSLDLPSFTPALQGLLFGLTIVLGFAFPMILRLRDVPTLRVIRREYGVMEPVSISTYVVGLLTLAAILYWRAGDAKLATYVLLGFLAGVAVAALVGFALVTMAARFRETATGPWRYGLANLKRRAFSSIVQIIALGLGIMALLVLTLVQGDLLDSWRKRLPPDSPNRFVVGIQPTQRADINALLAQRGLGEVMLYPTVRGRLVAVNDRVIDKANFTDLRTQRLVDREFNLSYANKAREDNLIVSGRWWNDGVPSVPEFSVEEWIAHELNIRVGDSLSFDIAGTRVVAKVSNIRKVDWDSFRVNFYVIASPGLLETMPTSYITGFYLKPTQETALNDLIRAFPNLTVIDVAAIMARFRVMTEQVAQAVQFVFLFTVLAGLSVLYAAIGATLDERIFESAIMRTVGAQRHQLLLAQLAEFSALGLASGLLGALGALGLGHALSANVLNLPFTFNPWIVLWGVLGGTLGVSVAGMIGIRGAMSQPPLEVIRRLA